MRCGYGIIGNNRAGRRGSAQGETMTTETIIRIQWEGPIAPANVDALGDTSRDCGIYQIYGAHPLYGTDVLLYIGLVGEKADSSRTFADRLSDYRDVYGDNVRFYVGRLCRLDGQETPPADAWSKYICWAERMLIFYHSPPHNSKNIQSLYPDKDDELRKEVVRVRNYGEYRSLMPEVSSDYFHDHDTQKALCDPWCLIPYSTDD